MWPGGIRSIDKKLVGIQDAKRSTQGRHTRNTMTATGRFCLVGYGQDARSTIKFVGIQDAKRSIHGRQVQVASKADAEISQFGHGRATKSTAEFVGIQDAMKSVSSGQLQDAIITIVTDPTSKFVLADSQEMEEAFIGNQ